MARGPASKLRWKCTRARTLERQWRSMGSVMGEERGTMQSITAPFLGKKSFASVQFQIHQRRFTLHGHPSFAMYKQRERSDRAYQHKSQFQYGQKLFCNQQNQIRHTIMYAGTTPRNIYMNTICLNIRPPTIWGYLAISLPKRCKRSKRLGVLKMYFFLVYYLFSLVSPL